ncbi:MAG TPA: EI24 domain-containing protein [Burkholderiaceae bacterium]|nr:EI24 domain-containing protein [Burkholderiaceae bacterium]
MKKNLMLDSFWRAAAYCLHPRVIALSFLPLVIMGVIAWGLAYFFWTPAVAWVQTTLESFSLLNTFMAWLQSVGVGGLKAFLIPMLVIVVLTPIVVVISLILVAVMMTPAMVSLVAERRFPDLERKQGHSLLASITWSMGATFIAILLLIVTIPLWLVPPLILIVPPLIWGWLTYRVMSFDALANHASKEERRTIMRQYRSPLLVIGIVTGYLGAAPSIVWASGILFAAAFMILIPIAIWIYTLVFGFASLWFSHFCLAALQDLRSEQSIQAPKSTIPTITNEAFLHENGAPDAPRSIN